MQDSGHTPEWNGPKVERTLRNGKHIYFSTFKAWLVEQASRPGASVAGLALRNGVNANLLRHWMKLGHWQSGTPTLLPVTVLAQQPVPMWWRPPLPNRSRGRWRSNCVAPSSA